ncbi:SMI1/KNR4 family protein [Brevibacillus invocatus]|uniref:SMI1/KNR4 family protein n=1 Tax=Brevibacillus invocatus TaxID=173959 RepID=A0A3M8CFF3_9BACL|nr:SMI1/KNR4 family protein [Brevibacillus invocatus]
MTLEKIEHFEATANIELPQDYRDFLLHIGDGARQDRQFPLSLSHAKDCLESSMIQVKRVFRCL